MPCSALSHPPGALSWAAPRVLEPPWHVDRWIRELLHVAFGEELLVTVGIGRERTRVAHHHFEELDALGPGDERAERVALVERDVRALHTAHVAARHLAVEHED